MRTQNTNANEALEHGPLEQQRLRLSSFGEKFAGDAGIVGLMEDLGEALRENPEMIFMGGGNPAYITEVEVAATEALQHILADEIQRHELMGVYQSPQGHLGLLDDLASLLQNEFGWPLTADNITLSNGSQAAFFTLFNMLAGDCQDSQRKRIHLPLVPEYLGYADVGLSEDFFSATAPHIALLDDQQFKYEVDFPALEQRLAQDKDIAALCVSRPTNPTGNVLTDAEIERLDRLAGQYEIPLIIDGAYGLPFPNIVFSEAKPFWSENTILILSLSKLGLPGMRTGIMIAQPALIKAFVNANTILNLAGSNTGPAIAQQLIKTQQLLPLANAAVKPYYLAQVERVVELMGQCFKGIPYRIHKPEGAIFLWLWFDGLPIDSQALYQRLKARGVLVVPGHHFFPGLDQAWPHRQACIRVSYAQPMEKIIQGIHIMADILRDIYQGQG